MPSTKARRSSSNTSGNRWVQNGSPLTGTGESGEGRFGESVAMAGNGSTVLVGAPGRKHQNRRRVDVRVRHRQVERIRTEARRPGGTPRKNSAAGSALSARRLVPRSSELRKPTHTNGEKGRALMTLYEALKSEWSETAGPRSRAPREGQRPVRQERLDDRKRRNRARRGPARVVQSRRRVAVRQTSDRRRTADERRVERESQRRNSPAATRSTSSGRTSKTRPLSGSAPTSR